MIKMTVFGGRVATNDKTQLKYYPETTNTKGAVISNRLTVPVLVNEKNQETPFNMVVTVWGKLADICAKSLSPGREINMILEPKQYQSNYKQGGQPVLINNEPLTITNMSYTVKEIKFGAESARHIASEIARGIRGVNWYTPGHQDNITLNERRKQVNNMSYTPGIATFGYAHIVGTTAPAAIQTPAAQTPAAQTPAFSQEMLMAALAHLQSQTAPGTVAPTAPTAPAQVQTVQTVQALPF